jgi:hypothetical protein
MQVVTICLMGPRVSQLPGVDEVTLAEVSTEVGDRRTDNW